MTEDHTVHAQESEAIVHLTADVVSAYVSNNPVPSGELPRLIADIHIALTGLGPSGNFKAQEVEERKPAVPIKKSVTNDEITCLECGKAYKSLKRHLMTHHGVTPEQYRDHWKLPRDYPMVAPSYAAARSDLAKTMGLGRKPRAAA
ncbi:MucR family transcriptional regulator [Mesorhizobium sp. SP-1A]|uniref:MucR family transcriptional regulator n=1 Tax=Mesorhizobium sp. SP-1A TaxID=3077840 RepID=UPI0028F70560|nr:MucR family transcriptional regulator [Mesorhizobium sp. SP-1A]